MRAVTITKSRGLEVVEIEPPLLASGEVRVDVACCGICGSDLHMLAMPAVPSGHVLGHELSGSITEVGREAGGWSVGERVTVLPMVACGACYACRAGHAHLCENGLMRGPGLGRQGGYAESVTVPAGMLHRLPDSVSDAHGALTEPLAVAIRGIALAQASPATAVVVLGAGPIGVMTAVGLRARGVERIAVVEPNAGRRALVSRLGFSAVATDGAAEQVAALLGGEPPTVAIDCSGHPSGVPLAVGLLPPGGLLVVVGIPNDPAPLDVASLATKELTIRGSLAYSTDDFGEALGHIAAGRIPCDEIVTTIADLGEAGAWFEDLASGATDQIKVLLRPRP
jgi:(R,R)-butanediol dehydrogenase/meso-butanediol dehydrogenase/diacetyl reductase